MTELTQFSRNFSLPGSCKRLINRCSIEVFFALRLFGLLVCMALGAAADTHMTVRLLYCERFGAQSDRGMLQLFLGTCQVKQDAT